MSARHPASCVKTTDDALEGLLLWHAVLMQDAKLADEEKAKFCGTIETSNLSESRSALLQKRNPSDELTSLEIEPF